MPAITPACAEQFEEKLSQLDTKLDWLLHDLHNLDEPKVVVIAP